MIYNTKLCGKTRVLNKSMAQSSWIVLTNNKDSDFQKAKDSSLVNRMSVLVACELLLMQITHAGHPATGPRQRRNVAESRFG